MISNVQAQVQGGHLRMVDVIGRLGKSKVLIRYQLQDGTPRERWVAADRVVKPLSAEQLATLQPYKKTTCPGGVFDVPLTVLEWWDFKCPRCAQQHRPERREWSDRDIRTVSSYEERAVLVPVGGAS